MIGRITIKNIIINIEIDLYYYFFMHLKILQ